MALTHVPPPALQHGERTFVSREPIDFALAELQHTAYCDLLRELGASVVTLDVNRAHADAVFIEDTAIVLPEIAVMTMPGAESRRLEPRGIERELGQYRAIRRVELPATLDGGDVVVAGREILVGASSRSNVEGAEALQRHTEPFGYRVRRVSLRDCLHLKSACCVLPDGTLLVNPDWLGEPSELADFGLRTIHPDEPFAADFATVGSAVIMSETNPRTTDMVTELGFDVHPTPLSEFEKAEGGVTCLSLIFEA